MENELGRFESDTAHRLTKWQPGGKRVPSLLVLRGPVTGLRIALPKRRVTVGRSVDADVVLDDRLVSRRHAEIAAAHPKGSYEIADLDSTNGTYLNGRRVRRARLSDGDKILVGSAILRFALEDPIESESGERFERLMFEDELTGLVVLRRFESDLGVHLESARSLGQDLSVLMLDLDDLKGINDRHGHPVGAYVIAQAGKMIGELLCGPMGQACRFGGDEFIAYRFGSGKREALQIGAAVCERIRARPLEKDGLSLKVTVSIGVATFPEDGDEPEALTRAADAALYRAKAKGRDTVSA